MTRSDICGLRSAVADDGLQTLQSRALVGGGVGAQEHFARSLAVARQQQAKSWGLRASMSMARLWRDQSKRQQAHDLLALVYGWFTQGFDTLDLKQAKASLDELTP